MFLGIDLGTSSVKIIIMNNDFAVVAQSSHEFMVSRPKPLWSEQDPHDWWQGTCAAMKILKNLTQKN